MFEKLNSFAYDNHVVIVAKSLQLAVVINFDKSITNRKLTSALQIDINYTALCEALTIALFLSK
jgi:hypothetical protein